MDAGALGGVIGVGFMAFIVIVCMIRERCQQKKVIVNKPSHFVEITRIPAETHPIIIERVLTKKHSSIRDFFKENTSSELKTIRIS